MLTALQTTILSALAAFLKGETYEAPSDIDWKELFKESVQQAVALPCLQGLLVAKIPDEVKLLWQEYAMNSFQTNARIHAQHDYVHRLLTAERIPYVVLKGSASAYYYPDPFMRSMGDVDFLVADENVSRVVALLKERDFTQKDMQHPSHLVFYKGKAHFELHFKPAGLPDGKLGDKIQEELASVFENSIEQDLSGNRIQKPSDFHHGLIILMHTYHHLLAEGIGLRHLCDWAVFVKYFEGEGFADVFKEKLSAVGLWEFARIFSFVTYKYLKIPYATWMGEVDEALCEGLIEDIFSGGNFGGKDDERSVQGMSISNRGKGGVKKSKLVQIFVSANASGKTVYPRLAKVPVLKHFCFVPLGVRYSFRVLTGKRKRVKVLGNMKRAEERKQIYKQFHLFEVKKNEK